MKCWCECWADLVKELDFFFTEGKMALIFKEGKMALWLFQTQWKRAG
jgi:hypothetical protein